MSDKRPYVDVRAWSAGRHLDPIFQERFRTKWLQRTAKVVAIVVVVGLISFGVGRGLGG